MWKRMLTGEIYRALVLGLLLTLSIVITSVTNRNVYSKHEVESLLQSVEEKHSADMDAQNKQLDHIQHQVDTLVEVLIER
jgi:hypothetical protein